MNYDKATKEKAETIENDTIKNMYLKARASSNRQHAIRVHCLECMGWVSPEVKECRHMDVYFINIGTDIRKERRVHKIVFSCSSDVI